MGATAATTSNRIVTIPNGLSLVRLACLPWFVWLLLVQDDRANAAWLLGALGATDWVDGYIARHFDQVSELGKVLDPTADRLLFLVGVGGIIIDGSAPLWFSVLVLAREALLGITLIVLTLMGMERFDVRWAGKAGTFLLMFAFPFFLMGAAGDNWFEQTCSVAAWVVGIPGLVVSYYAAFRYVPVMRQALAAGRRGKP
jgi:cardiolipin synthase (CMP-forming)